MNSKGTQPYTYMYLFSPKLPSYPGCHIALSRFACALQQVLVIRFKYSSAYIEEEGNGTPLQSSCLENPLDRGAW